MGLSPKQSLGIGLAGRPAVDFQRELLDAPGSARLLQYAQFELRLL